MNVFELVAKISLDSSEYDSKLNDASNKTKSIGSTIGNALGTVGKATGVALAAGSAAVTKLTKDAVAAYGEFEQLKGGMETLYGKDAQTMLDNAEKAFKTAGLNANEYMDTAIQSSAAMISSLDGDTKEAAKLTDMAIIDMSDNVNKMGTSMESIQNAYKGFSRGNFTMLDNLALGFAGTKDGMQELLDKAKELSGVDYNIDSYADIVKAIHVVQKEMGITGTTSKEAADTITGSMGMAKKAWQNLTVAIANGDWNLDEKIDDFVNSLEGAFVNLMPIVQKALDGVGKLIEKLAPIIAEKLPQIINELLPPLLSSAATIIGKLAENLPTLLTTLVDVVSQNLPMLTQTLVPALTEGLAILIGAVVDNAPQLFETLIQAIDDVADEIGDKLAEKFPEFSIIFENLETVVWLLVDAFIAYKAAMAITSVINGVKKAMTALKKITELQTVAQKALNFVTSMSPWVWVAAAIAAVVAILVILWNNCEEFRDGVKKIAKAIGDFFVNLGKKIKDTWNKVVDWIADKIGDMVDFVKSGIEKVKEFFINAGEKIKEIWQNIKDFFAGIWEGIKSVFSAVVEFFRSIFQGALDIVKFIWDTITGFFSGIWEGIKSVFSAVGDFFSGVFSGAVSLIESAWDGIVGFFGGVWEGIKGVFGAVGDFFSSVFGPVADLLDALFGKVTGLNDAANSAANSIKGLVGGQYAGGSANKSGYARTHAVGGVVRKGEIAILEGTGAEAVVPLDRNRKWVRAVANEFALAGGGSLGGGDIVIPVYVGNERLDTLVVKANQTNNYRSGGRG